MKRSNSGYASYFDPLEWDAASETAHPAASYFTFQRGRDLATHCCLKHSREGDCWLDVGCGSGQLVAKLASRERRIWGMDHDRRMLERARQRLTQFQSTFQPQFVSGTAWQHPFLDQSFDGIIATSLLGCLTEPEKFFRESFRILRDGGALILTFTNRESLLLRFNYLFRKQGSGRFRTYSQPEVMGGLSGSGFQIREIKYYNFFLNSRQWMFPPRIITLQLDRLGKFPLSRYLGRNFLVLAQKNRP